MLSSAETDSDGAVNNETRNCEQKMHWGAYAKDLFGLDGMKIALQPFTGSLLFAVV